jgi:hypothetical protein
MSVAEQSSDVRVGGLVPIDSRRDNECIDIAETRSLTEPLERYFLSGSPLCPVELLMYALIRIQFKKSPAFVLRARITNNVMKSTVGKENGKVRWSYFSLNVDKFIRVSGKDLETFLINSSHVLSEDVIVTTSEQLKSICSKSANRDYNQLSAHHFVSEFNNNIRK